MLKMTTYPGMSLGGEVRESISLDEDDLSDVEDEVFIRDGKNSYKLAEELNVKRPLMPPRRKLGKPDITGRLKARPSCRAFCRPCCYILAGLSVLIGLIVLVVVLVSIFPLPLDKFRNWFTAKSVAKPTTEQRKLLPCSNLKITDIWSVHLPFLTTDSPVRILDVNQDSIDDVIFGFGTGDNYNILPSNLFCTIFMGVSSPCHGGVVALNGINGRIEWRYWTNDTIFNLHCNEDLNGDNQPDCLAVGVEGTMTAINTKNGTAIWRQDNAKMDVFVANFIPDQNNDSIADILSSHTNLQGNEGHLVLICGRTGNELQRIPLPNRAKTFYMPQTFDNSTMVLFGTGSPVSSGTLNVTPLNSIVMGNLTSRPIYVDRFKGVFTQSVLVDLTGDGINDIVTAMYNSTLVAINGRNFQQIWNFTVPNSETNIVPTPGYFNYDNITDFLIIYQKFDNILKYNYSNTFIIDGKTGKSIYESPIAGSVLTQMGGLTLSMEGYGYDMFVFWTTECKNVEILRNNQIITKGDGCKQFNASNVIKLNALNQCDQPPGFEVYSSVNRTTEFIDIKSPMKQIKEYLTRHFIPEQGQAEIDEHYIDNAQKLRIHKYGTSNFRHKDNRQGVVKDYMDNNENTARVNDEVVGPKYLPNYDWQNAAQTLDNSLPGDIDNEFNNYEDSETSNLFNRKLFDEINGKNTRDPRSKIESMNQFVNDDFIETPETTTPQSPDATTSTITTTKYGIDDYQNIKMARNRLLRDLNNLPNEILLDTFLKNRENQLRKSRFEQRDINSHIDHIKEKEEMRNILEAEKRRVLNASFFTLWDLESEKELEDRQKDNWRSKREINSTSFGIRKVTSVGALLQSLNQTNNSIDIVFVTYWQSPRMTRDDFSEKQIAECVEEKFSNFAKDKDSYSKTTEMEQKTLLTDECLTEQNNLRNAYPYYNDLHQLRSGQLTVYRLRIECECNAFNNHERCAKFLPYGQQCWNSYLGRDGDGTFFTRN